MADRYQPYEDDYGREWRGRHRDRDDMYRGRDREDWRGREEERRGRERGWREDWRRGEPEWRGSREFRAGDRTWRGEGEPYGHQRGEMTYRGTWDRDRYPDENYGGRQSMRGEWSDERRPEWEREPWGGDWRTMSRDPGYDRSGWGGRPFGMEGPGWAGSYGWLGRERERGLYGTEAGRGEGEYASRRSGWPGDEARYGTYMGRGPKGYRRSDERITEDVCDRLTDDPMVDASDITVQVREGEVTLSGTVEDRHQKRRAEDVVEQVPGVRDVSNQLRVTKGFFSQIFGAGEEQPRTAEGRAGQEQKQHQRPKVAP